MLNLVKSLLFLIVIGFISGCNALFEPGKELEQKEQKLQLQYVGWACDCPSWMYSNLQINTDNIDCDKDTVCVEIEAAYDSLKIPDDFAANPCGSRSYIFTGRFYKDKQKFPGNDRTIRARTFRYTKYEYVPTADQQWNEKHFKIKEQQALKKVNELPAVKNFLKNGEEKSFINYVKCPEKADPFYYFELIRETKADGQVVMVTIRLNPNSGKFGLLDQKTERYKPLSFHDQIR